MSFQLILQLLSLSGWLFLSQEPHMALDIFVTTGSGNGFAC